MEGIILFHSLVNSAAAAKSLQSCPTLCDPIDGSPSGSSVPGILQARTLEWVAISFSNAWKWKVKGKSLSHVWLLATPWTAAYQAPTSMGVSRQEYWSGLPLPSLQGHLIMHLNPMRIFSNIKLKDSLEKYEHWGSYVSSEENDSWSVWISCVLNIFPSFLF